MSESRAPSDPRVRFYCHDTYGLGHLRRTLTLAQGLRNRTPAMSQLIVTGSPVAQSFPYPEGADYIKLPSVVKVGSGRYESRTIRAPFAQIRDLRADIVTSAARHFRPDVLVVDHAPAGLKGEVVPALRHMKRESPESRLVLGLRDVVDEASHVRETWRREGAYELFDEIYDRILVYGDRTVYDVVAEYGLSRRAAAKVRYGGYLRRPASQRSSDEVRAELGLRTDRLVVVTAGGGGDGRHLFRAMGEALRRRTRPVDFDCLLVGGPLMSEDDRASLQELAAVGAHVHVLDFAKDMAGYLAAADAVVSMGGYNTVCELLSLERPSLIVPRVTPRKEQLIRAEALERRGLVRMLHPDDLSPSRLLAAVTDLLDHPPVASGTVAMGGVPAVAAELSKLLGAEGLSNAGAHHLPALRAASRADAHRLPIPVWRFSR